MPHNPHYYWSPLWCRCEARSSLTHVSPSRAFHRWHQSPRRPVPTSPMHRSTREWLWWLTAWSQKTQLGVSSATGRRMRPRVRCPVGSLGISSAKTEPSPICQLWSSNLSSFPACCKSWAQCSANRVAPCGMTPAEELPWVLLSTVWRCDFYFERALRSAVVSDDLSVCCDSGPSSQLSGKRKWLRVKRGKKKIVWRPRGQNITFLSRQWVSTLLLFTVPRSHRWQLHRDAVSRDAGMLTAK